MSTALVDIKAQLKAQLMEQRERVAPPSGQRISTKGKVFALPDGRTSTGPLDAIILDFRITHAYYTGLYDPKNPKPPICWAVSRTLECKPDESIVQPKFSCCLGRDENGELITCPMNEYKSASQGNGKACKEGRRLAIIPPDATADSEIWTLDVSPTGIRSFEAYMTRLRESDHHSMEVVTQIAFKADEAYPTLVFAPKPKDALLDDERLAIAFTLAQRAGTVLDLPLAQ